MPQPDPVSLPRHYYIIAATPRTGSSLLCDVLDATGIAGHPEEFYSTIIRWKWLKLWQLSPDARPVDLWQASLRRRTTPNGWHGVKIHSYQWLHGLLHTFAQERGTTPWALLAQLYPEARYIFLRRSDRRGQALSLFRAEATGAWHRHRPDFRPPIPLPQEETPPLLNTALVRGYEARMQREEDAWRAYFAHAAITPLEVLYEDLCRDIQWEVARVLDFLDLPTVAAYTTVSPRLMRQADAVTAAWRVQMEKEEAHGVPRPHARK